MFAGSIYGVRKPGDTEFRYVGLTSGTVARRRLSHFKAMRHGRKTPFYDWLRKFESTEDVFFQPLEVVPGDHDALASAERRWIAELRAHGHRLLNLTDGGDAPTGYVWTAEQRRAASLRNRGRKGIPRRGADNPMWGRMHSEAQKVQWSTMRQGSITGPLNPNYGKFGPAHPSYGRQLSAETSALLSEQKRAEKNPNFGKSASTETRAKMSAVRKGRPMPSSVRSAHTRYHINKGVFNDACRHCMDDRQTQTTQGNEVS